MGARENKFDVWGLLDQKASIGFWAHRDRFLAKYLSSQKESLERSKCVIVIELFVTSAVQKKFIQYCM